MMHHDTQAQLSQYVAAIYEPDDIVEVRRLPSGRSTWHAARDLPAQSQSFARENTREHVYFGAQPRKAVGGKKAEDVALARCLFVDFDGGASADDARARLASAGLPTPTLLVCSGHGVHAYWRLSEPINELAEYTAMQRALAAAVGSDPTVHDPPRIMRAPGTVNHKPPATACYIVAADATRRYTQRAIEVALANGESALPLTRAAQLLEAPTIGEGQRNDALLAMLGRERIRYGDGDFAAFERRAHELNRTKFTKPLDDAEVSRVAKSSWGYRNNEAAPAPQAALASAEAAGVVFELAEVSRVESSGRLRLKVYAKRDSVKLAVLNFSSVFSSHVAAFQQISIKLSGNAKYEREAVLEAFSQLVIAGEEIADRPAPPQLGDTMQDIVKRVFAGAGFTLAYQIPSGAFSEDRRKKFTRALFVEEVVGNHTLDLLAAAVDAPRDKRGCVIRTKLYAAAKMEAELLFADLIRKLPPRDEADVDRFSEAGLEHWQKMRELWKRQAQFAIHAQAVKSGDERERTTVSIASRQNCASRVRHLLGSSNYPAGAWHRVQDSLDAWFRQEANGDGMKVYLAMRADLAGQLGVPIPDVKDQTQLHRLGVKFGTIDDDPRKPNGGKLPAVTTGGKHRLAVLSDELTAELLAEAPTGAEEDDAAEMEADQQQAARRYAEVG